MNNKHIKWIGMFVLLLLMQTAVQAYLLPTSDIWQGSDQWNRGNGIQAYVEWAVYKSANLPSGITVPPGDAGKYLYVYQVWNTGGKDGNGSVGTLEVVSGKVASIKTKGSSDDGKGGLVPDRTQVNNATDTTIHWEFDGGVFVVDKHSAYLAFTSDYAPVDAKSYALLSTTGMNPATPGNSTGATSLNGSNNNDATTIIPEPTTIALLSFGALSLFRKKN